MSSDALADAIALLRQERAAHAEQVARIDAALAALLAVVDEPSASAVRREAARPAPLTTRQMAVRLMEEEDRVWTAPEILAEYERRGERLPGKDPANSLRTALVTAVRVGEVERLSVGHYKATKFARGSDSEVSCQLIDLSPAINDVVTRLQGSNGSNPTEEEVSTS